MRNQGTERVRNLPKVTWLFIGRAGLNPGRQTPESMFLNMTLAMPPVVLTLLTINLKMAEARSKGQPGPGGMRS